MKDSTHQPRRIPYSVERLETILEAALEHASHGWHALEQEKKVNRLNPDAWPPQVEAEVGSSEYHLSAMITYLFEAFGSIHNEAEHTRDVSELVEKFRSDHGL